MVRLLLLLFVLTVPLAPGAAAPPAPSPAPPAAISADQARTALDVLNDPKKRAAFAATLDAIIKGQPAPVAAPAPAEASPEPARQAVEGLAIPLAPDSLGAQVLVGASAFLNHAGNQAVDALQAAQSMPLLWSWVAGIATNEVARNLLADAAWRLVVVMAFALGLQLITERALRAPAARMERRARGRDEPVQELEPEADEPDPEPPPVSEADTVARAEAGDTEAVPPPKRRHPSAAVLLRRVPFALGRFALDLVPVLGFLLIGHLLTGTRLGGSTMSRLLLLAVVDAYAVCAAVLCVGRMLLSPGVPSLRLLPLSDSAAGYLKRWARRFVLLAVIGYAVGELGLLLGLSEVVHDALQKAVGLALHICVAIIVVQKRRTVRHWLRAPVGATGPIAVLRNGMARSWHWFALFILVTGWVVWAIEVPHGFATMLHYLLVTLLVLVGMRLLLLVVAGLLDRLAMIGPATADTYPGIEARIRRYHPGLAALLRGLVYLVSVFILLQLYGLGAVTWLVSSTLGQHIVSSLGSLAVTIVLALLVWETVNAAIQRHLARLQREAQAARSARLRTLLPLLRTTLMIAIIVVAGLMVLSEIGVNIAPLLAGAGIVGVAIGFGSQKLVQDLITGIFLLLENAMQVGDFVTVSGLSGTVEALSVRTIRLRAGDGSVHIIPFSAVTSVTNVNRGMGNASISVTVDYAEDTDRVAEVLRGIITGMRADPDFAVRMLSDLQLWGVDKVDGAGVTLLGQVVCTDSGRWPVQREFNRRMKQRFQELGIRIYNPLRTISVAERPQASPMEGVRDDPVAPAD